MALFRRAHVDISVPHHDSTIRLGDGRRLAYAEYGQPDGKPVLWFHGTPGARWQIPPDASAAARERGFRIIGVDRPGVGGSTHHPGRSLLSFARDVEKLRAALGLERFAVIGLSGGGPYVLACAHEMPERVVVGASLGGLAPLHGDDRAPTYPRPLRMLMRAIASTHMPLGIALSLAV